MFIIGSMEMGKLFIPCEIQFCAKLKADITALQFLFVAWDLPSKGRHCAEPTSVVWRWRWLSDRW